MAAALDAAVGPVAAVLGLDEVAVVQLASALLTTMSADAFAVGQRDAGGAAAVDLDAAHFTVGARPPAARSTSRPPGHTSAPVPPSPVHAPAPFEAR